MPWRQLWGAARCVHPGPVPREQGRRLVFVARALLHYREVARWFDFLQRHGLAAAAARHPSLYRKPLRPYVSRHWRAAEKAAVLISHYEFMARTVRPEVRAEILADTGTTLATLTTRDGEILGVRARYDSKFRKEGEITLELVWPARAVRVASLTFVFARLAGGSPAAVIGAVSGLPAGADKEIIKHVARGLHGWRPWAVLLLVLQELATGLGVPTLLAVGSCIHTSRHPAYALNRSRRFAIRYDDYWEEEGGRRRADGFYHLPSAHEARPLAALAPNKRSQYRRREELIAGLRTTLARAVAAWRVPGEAPPAVASVRWPDSTPSRAPVFALVA